MAFDVDEGMAVLMRTPSVLRAMLSGLSPEWTEANLATLQGWGLDDAKLSLQGVHPTFGAVTLRQLLATWVAHDLGHIVQIARVMAKQYREAIGPWRAYLSVMER